MTEDLDEASRERADHVREKRHERADPEDRVGRVLAHEAPPEDLDLPAPEVADDLELPAAVHEEFENTRKKLTYGLEQEYGIELDADDDYWPLVVHLGLERLKGMWLEEVKRTLESTEGIDEPE